MNISRSGPAMVEPGSKRPGVARRAALVGAAVMAMGLGAVAPAQASVSTTQVQWDLAGMGYLPWSGIDGSYGPQTTTAVQAFQSDACIATDGQVGPITEGKLATQVIKIQKVVGSTQTGLFTATTRDKVKAWQSAHGLTADGQAGPATMRAMGIARLMCTVVSGTKQQRILTVAKSQLGVLEGSAADKYLAWIPDWSSAHTTTTPWCAAFVSWVVNYQTSATSMKSVSVSAWYDAAKNRQNGLSLTTTPVPGDLALFDWSSNGYDLSRLDHIGIVTSNPAGSVFYTIEGNTSGGYATDGVRARTRYTGTSDRVYFIHIS